MGLKSFRFSLLTIGFLVASNSMSLSATTLSPHNFNTLYNLAARGDVATINAARSRGLNIDAVNHNGDTGLCVAAKRYDRKAYRSFLQSGANPSHPCTWEIGDYREFMQSSIENTAYNINTANQEQQLSELKMGWETKFLIGSSILAAGAGVGFALGGGGGGGSSYDPNCVHGDYKDDVCTCYNGYTGGKCNECASGYGNYGTNSCHLTLDCKNGYQKGDKCVCDSAYSGKFCHSCANGYGKDETGQCVRKSSQKVIGNADMNTNYNPSESLYVHNVNYTDVYGMFYDADKTPHNYLLDQDKFANEYTLSASIDAEIDVEDYDRNADGNIVWYAEWDKSSGTAPVPLGYLIGAKAYANNHNDSFNSPAGSMLNDIVYGNNGEILGYVYKTGTTTEEKSFFIVNSQSAITIKNTSDGTVYGLYSTNAQTIYNNYVKLDGSGKVVNNIQDQNPGYSSSTLDITNKGDGNIYGIYGNHVIYSGDFDEAAADEGSASIYSYLNIENIGNGDAYGYYIPSADGEVYHLSKKGSLLSLTSRTSVKNTYGTGNTYGIYALGKIENSGLIFSTADAGNAYGLYTKGGAISNTKDENEESVVKSIEAISDTGNAYGAYLEGGSIENGRIIMAKTLDGTGNAYGIYATSTKGSTVSVTNTSGLEVESFGGDAYGIYNKGGTVKNTTQRYEINVTSLSGTAYGIYSDGGSVENTGRFVINGSTDAKSYGIYATNGAKVTNSGDFLFNIRGTELNPENADIYCTSSGCLTPCGGYAIYLTNGAKFVNAGTVSSDTPLNLGDQGTQLSTNGQFIATSLEGNLEVEKNVVASGFDSTYTISNAIQSEDVSNLKLSSESALFDAKLQGTDVVLSKKDFDEVVENKNLATYLEQNYASENNEKLFTELKSMTNVSDVNLMLNKITGQDMVSRFTDEDLLLQQELNFDINEKLFKTNENTFSFAGNFASNTFDYDGEQTSYAVSGTTFGKVRLGVGMAVSQIKTDSTSNNTRDVSNYQFMAPIQLKNRSSSTILTPQFAYSYGTYSREGYNNLDYKGKIEKQAFGISAQSKYKFDLMGLNIIPTSEANIFTYRTQISENDQQFSLKSENTPTYSANLGFGAFIEKEQSWKENHSLNFMLGAMVYHEFANPYDLEMKINHMSGSFTLRDENHKDDYMVLRSKFSYNLDNMSVYGDIFSYIDNKYRSRIDLGFKYSF